jgi:Fur family ferric uptake transcriptional regulator
VNLSTVYRGLEALEQVGLVRHTHLGAGGSTYHLAAASDHLHLQCNNCGRIISLEQSAAESFAALVRDRTGFLADLTHGAIYGQCADCVADDRAASDEEDDR